MAKITYQDKVDLYENANVQHINKVIADDMNEIKEAVNDNENKILIAISDTAPSECSVGDLYYNTSTKKVYEAIDVDTWDTNGTYPTSNTIYILFDTKTTYSYDGNDLVSVGGGGAEIAVSTTEPTGEEDDSVKIWINPNEAPSGSLNPISNTYGVAQDKGYSQEYLNGKLEDVYSTTETKTNKVWINGKPIYRKVIEITNLGRGYKQHQHNISNLDEVIDISGYWKDNTENNYNSISRVVCDNIATYGTGILNVDATYFYSLVGTSVGTTNKVYVIFEYTKTTD